MEENPTETLFKDIGERYTAIKTQPFQRAYPRISAQCQPQWVRILSRKRRYLLFARRERFPFIRNQTDRVLRNDAVEIARDTTLLKEEDEGRRRALNPAIVRQTGVLASFESLAPQCTAGEIGCFDFFFCVLLYPLVKLSSALFAPLSG